MSKKGNFLFHEGEVIWRGDWVGTIVGMVEEFDPETNYDFAYYKIKWVDDPITRAQSKKFIEDFFLSKQCLDVRKRFQELKDS